MKRVLVACEFSGIVRDAFRGRGFDATSCDLLPSERPGPHVIGDVRPLLGSGWDLIIAHPPCTYLARSGCRWWNGRKAEQRAALEFVRTILGARCPRIALENPPGAIGTNVRKADQYIQPWQFGHPENKMTGLWLIGLPKLVPTEDVSEAMARLTTKEQNSCHWAAPGPDRWRVRSRTYQGIASAMADQWGKLL